MRIFKAATLITVCLFVVSTAHGIDPEAGTSAQGKEDIGQCRQCHNGEATKKLNPSSKTKKQWARYFKDEFKKLKRKHSDWASYEYKTDLLQNIHRYLNAHALDSDKPQTCD